jgi:hypothetical protein
MQENHHHMRWDVVDLLSILLAVGLRSLGNCILTYASISPRTVDTKSVYFPSIRYPETSRYAYSR